MKKYLLLALLPLACSNALAVKTASTSVDFSGEIYNNTSCSIAASTNSVDLGRHSSEAFDKVDMVQLEGNGVGEIPFTVNCTAPTSMGIEVISAGGDADYQYADKSFTASLAKGANNKDIAVLGVALSDISMYGAQISSVLVPHENVIFDLTNATNGADKERAIFSVATGNRFTATSDDNYDDIAIGQNLSGTFNYRAFLTPLSYIDDKSIQMQDSIALQASVNLSVHYL